MKSVDAELLRDLNEGIFERPIWQGFLERLRAHTGSVYTTLTFRAFRNENIALHAGRKPPEELLALVARDRLLIGLPFQKWKGEVSFGLDGLFLPDENEAKTRFRSRLLNSGIEFVQIQKIGDTYESRAWLTCAGAGKNEASTRALMAQLTPFVGQAVRTYHVIERERFSSAITYEAAKRSNVGWFVVDRECKIIDHTPVADEILDSSSHIGRDRLNGLHFRDSASGREVRGIIQRFASGVDAKPKALILSRDPWMDILISPIRRRLPLTEFAPVAIIYMRSDRRSYAEHCERLAEMFELTARESQLAWALAQGTSIADAALELGISAETARGYSKKIYSKIGVHRQAELVRVILTSVSMLG